MSCVRNYTLYMRRNDNNSYWIKPQFHSHPTHWSEIELMNAIAACCCRIHKRMRNAFIVESTHVQFKICTCTSPLNCCNYCPLFRENGQNTAVVAAVAYQLRTVVYKVHALLINSINFKAHIVITSCGRRTFPNSPSQHRMAYRIIRHSPIVNW